MITFATDIMRPLVTSETEILRHQHQTKREQNLYSMRSWRMRSGAAEFLRHAIKGLAELLKHAIKGLSEFLQHEIKGSCRISAARHRGFLQNFCSTTSRVLAEFLQRDIKGAAEFLQHDPPDQGVLQNFCHMRSRGQENFSSMRSRGVAEFALTIKTILLVIQHI